MVRMLCFLFLLVGNVARASVHEAVINVWGNTPIEGVTCGGSAFFISDTLVLTAGHITKDLDHSKVLYFIDSNGRQQKLSLIDWTWPRLGDKDIALYRSEEYTSSHYFCIQDREVSNGEMLTAIGDFRYYNPLCTAPGLIVLRGRMLNNQYNGDIDVSSIPSYKGFSGGPVLSEDGCVVGITSGYFNLGHDSIFTDLETIREFLNEYH